MSFLCSYCQKSFSFRANLNEHLEVAHEVERVSASSNSSSHPIRKDVACSHCKKKFKARSNLNRHLKTVHQEDKRNIVSYEFNAFTNKCLECYKSFVKAEQLRYHLMTDHSKAFPEENYQFSCREGDFNCYPVYNLL